MTMMMLMIFCFHMKLYILRELFVYNIPIFDINTKSHCYSVDTAHVQVMPATQMAIWEICVYKHNKLHVCHHGCRANAKGLL